jgi:hypothetical protein
VTVPTPSTAAEGTTRSEVDMGLTFSPTARELIERTEAKAAIATKGVTETIAGTAA